MKKFIKNIFILLIPIFIVTCCINYVYKKNSPNFGTMGNCKNDDAYIVDVPDGIELMCVGNSHGYYGFNFDKYKNDYVCFNFSLSSQSMSYNYRVMENYRDKIKDGAVIFICISYTSFFGQDETALDNFESKNKRYYHFLDRKYIKEYDLKTDIFVRYLPSLGVDSIKLIDTLQGRVENRDYWNKQTSRDAALKHGAARYKSQIEINVDSDGNRIMNETEINSVYDLINLCREEGAVPILITTPFLSEYTNPIIENDPEFFDDFYEIIEKIQNDTGVDYYDYGFDDRFSSNYKLFFNTDHLNRKGARKFVDILMKEIVSVL
ncbi:MAG: hypothetical protein K2G45_08595 [Lachnospiraceae bacterium]|nr:hypothetical protein [Lachnospiraceae bacterium]